MNYISDAARCRFWRDRLCTEILPKGTFQTVPADMGHDPNAAHDAADACLQEFQNAPEPDHVHYSGQFAKHWLKLGGDNLARKEHYRCHDGSDALRFWLSAKHGISFAEAFDLSDEQLIWIFSEIDPVK